MTRFAKIRKWIVFGLAELLWALPVGAAPAWESRTAGLPETDVRRVAPAGDGGELLAASNRRLYRYSPGSKAWKQVLGLRAPDEVMEIAADAHDPKVFWLATRRTLRRSVNSGRSWKTVFRRDSESGFQVRTIAAESPQTLWVGTTEGLYRFELPEASLVPIEGAPKGASIDSLVRGSDGWLIGTVRGVYRADGNFRNWELLDGDLRREPAPADGALGQFSVEEIAGTPAFANAVIWPRDGRVLMGRPDGVFENGAENRQEIRRIAGTNGLNVRRLAADEAFVYLATDRGVYRLAPGPGTIENISQGLESLDVSTVAADPKSGAVWAGTRKGLFRLDAPQAASSVPRLAIESIPKESPSMLAWPAHEPTIGEIQQAAIHYAEVSPEKIKAWREAASKKAFFPTVSFDTNFNADQNVDIDRGGTNDPDRFIIGPEEEGFDWSVDFSWNLGDLIWNDDQTSIDVRSRLMVELRNDILNDVTHLYFERRRAQMELAALPPDAPRLRAEKELKLAELTAQIDALTDGYLSSRLAKETSN